MECFVMGTSAIRRPYFIPVWIAWHESLNNESGLDCAYSFVLLSKTVTNQVRMGS